MISIHAPYDDPWQDWAELRIAIRGADGSMQVPRSIEWETIDPNYCAGVIEPILIVSRKTPEGDSCLRKLMDQLWALGVRPTEQGSPGQLKATEAHLETCKAILSATVLNPKAAISITT